MTTCAPHPPPLPPPRCRALPAASPRLSVISPSALRAPHSPSPAILLDGLGRLLQFLFEQEADFLCGAPRHMRTHKRVNYRIGYYARTFRTPLGVIPIRIPHLLYFHHRVPIVKRARRLAPEILETLSQIGRASCRERV